MILKLSIIKDENIGRLSENILGKKARKHSQKETDDMNQTQASKD